jgi:hypothetical protein
MSSHQDSGDGNAGQGVAVERDDDIEEDYDYTYGYGENGYEIDDYPAYYDYEGEGYGEHDGSDYYGESGDDYGDGIGIETFESKFGTLKHFALNLHTGKYDNEIEQELRSDVIVERAGNRREIDPADLDARRVIAEENLKLQLKGLAHEADTGILSSITLMSDSTRVREIGAIPPNVEEPVLSHDPSFDEYWKEFFTSLENADKAATKITNINISKIEMTKDVVDQLVRFLRGQTSTLKFITFNNTNLCREGLISLSMLVEQCPALEMLDLSHNPIDDMNAANCLLRALRSHPRIRSLNLTYCNLGNNPEILSVILESEVKDIDFGNNSIDSLGAVGIVECIESNSHTERLYIGKNNLNDEDALAISRALKRNTTLTRLNLEKNNFTSIGVKTLFGSVFNNSSLNAISKCNHRCKIIVVNGKAKIQENFSSINTSLDRTDKLLLALLDKESLREYLSDVPIEFMPEVLAFLQRNNMIIPALQRSTSFHLGMTPSHTLNMVYSCMRWWNMPSLYSFYGNVSSGIKRKRNLDDIYYFA